MLNDRVPEVRWSSCSVGSDATVGSERQHLWSVLHGVVEQSTSGGRGQSGPVQGSGHRAGLSSFRMQQRGRSGAGPSQQSSGSWPSPGTSSHSSTSSWSSASLAACTAAIDRGTSAAPVAPAATLLFLRKFLKNWPTRPRVNLKLLMNERLDAKAGVTAAEETPAAGLAARNRLNGLIGERLVRWASTAVSVRPRYMPGAREHSQSRSLLVMSPVLGLRTWLMAVAVRKMKFSVVKSTSNLVLRLHSRFLLRNSSADRLSTLRKRAVLSLIPASILMAPNGVRRMLP